jgi:hypothetical protein
MVIKLPIGGSMGIMSALIISYAFSLGLSYDNVVLWKSDRFTTDAMSQNLVTSQFDVSIGLKGFYLGGGSEVPAMISSIKSYVPVKNTYNFKVGYNYKVLEIGYVHHCSHPHVLSTSAGRLDYVADGLSDKFFVSVKHQFNPF